jgi:hypothetical protein
MESEGSGDQGGDRKKRKRISRSLELCKERQKKRLKNRFALRNIPRAVNLADAPTVLVLKKYARFERKAVEAGWLKNPVPAADEPYFEVYDVTSGGTMAGDLSPMVMGPVVDQFGDIVGCNVEDAWQGLKVWPCHMDPKGRFDRRKQKLWDAPGTVTVGMFPYTAAKGMHWLPKWTRWSRAVRFSGQGRRHWIPSTVGCKELNELRQKPSNPSAPLFSWYRDKAYCYVSARKLTYCRWYSDLLRGTGAFKELQRRLRAGISLILLDHDGQPRDGSEEIDPVTEASARKRINDESKIFGHGFVLACCLLGIDVWSDEKF